MLVDSTSIPLRNLQSSPPASCHGKNPPSQIQVSFFDFQLKFTNVAKKHLCGRQNQRFNSSVTFFFQPLDSVAGLVSWQVLRLVMFS